MKQPKYSETHNYESFADQYAQLGFTDTYYLKFRDIPLLMQEFGISVGDAIDHGCGAGLSTRFLKNLNFQVIGVDRTAAMLEQARKLDPTGTYCVVPHDKLDGIEDRSKDLVFQSSVLEEYSSRDSILRTVLEFNRVLRPKGMVVVATASEDAPKGEWVSLNYSTYGASLKSGDRVQCVVRNTGVVFSDYYWTDSDLQSVFVEGGFEVLKMHHPLGKIDEPFKWLGETQKSPWSIYVLAKRHV